ncbi:MAG: tetratricopeptide repeat protein [Deltaproteobacteria bacterium]|nr:tetratricopeptide repeat protein [Deltaproteobacteria bacterium]
MALKDKILERAQLALQKGNLEKAAIEYKAAFDLDPKDATLRLKIGDIYVKVGKKAEAVAEYKEVAKSYSQKGFYLKSIAVYKQILKLEEFNYEVHYKLAELYAKQRLISDAISEYSILVNSFEKKGKTGEVMQLLKEMLDIDPENIGIRLKLAELYQKLSFDKDALAEYGRIFAKYMALDKLDKAEKLYTVLITANPKEATLLKGLAELYKKKGAAAMFLKYSKDLYNVYVAAADGADGAKAVCEMILEVAPHDAESLNYLGRKPIAPVRYEEIMGHGAGGGEPLIEFPTIDVSSGTKAALSGAKAYEEKEEPLISWPEETQGGRAQDEAPLISIDEHVEEAHEEVGEGELEIEVELPDVGDEALSAPDIEAQGEIEVEFDLGAEAEAAPEPVNIQAEIDALFKEAVASVSGVEAEPQEMEIEVEAPAVAQGQVDEFFKEGLEEAVSEDMPVVEREEGQHPSPALSTPPIETFEGRLGQAVEEVVVSHEDLSKAIIEMTEETQPEALDVKAGIVEEPALDAGAGQGDEYVDLASELGLDEPFKGLSSFQREDGGRSVAPDDAGAGMNSEDYETHYNLGIAYMEMELTNEAVKEFKLASRDPRIEFECYTRLALCARGQGNPEEAITYYTKGLKVQGRSDEERKGMMYELALAYEAADKTVEAGKLFSAINSLDPAYRDTAKKAKEYTEVAQTIPLDDDRIEVEFL